MTRDINAYQANYAADHGFEREMVHYRQRLLLERLNIYSPKRVIEVGCGLELLSSAWREKGGVWDEWVIVEPSADFAAAAKSAGLKHMTVYQAFFEEVAPSLQNWRPDLVICSGLLHEVIDAGALLNSIVSVMAAGAVVHINVPHANSFHRRLAVAMKLIGTVHELGIRNKELQQHRVYDLKTLQSEVTAVGLVIKSIGGHLVKPFSHSQMDEIQHFMDRNLLDGLYELGKSDPEWASEIYVEAVI